MEASGGLASRLDKEEKVEAVGRGREGGEAACAMGTEEGGGMNATKPLTLLPTLGGG